MDIYDFTTEEYRPYRITREEHELLQIISRLTAEGIVKENDDEWVIG